MDMCPALRALVVGGSPDRPSPGLLRDLAAASSLIIACDGGADACLAAQVRPSVFVGDADSVSEAGMAFVRASGAVERRFPMDKDEVDLRLALDVAREELLGGALRGHGDAEPKDSLGEGQSRGSMADRGRRLAEVVLCGVSGARPDHALAAIGTCMRYPDLCPRMEEDGFTCVFLDGALPEHRSSWELGPDDVGKTFSVIALVEGTVVSEAGMKWSVDHLELAPLEGLAVSNVVVGGHARIVVHSGVAACYLLRERIEKAAVGE